jgi:subtilisin family serine protease
MPRFSPQLPWAWLTLTGIALAVQLAPPPQALSGGAPARVPEQSGPDVAVPPQVGSPAWHRKQLLARLGVEPWHTQGHRGRGVKVAILDSGFRGYRDPLGKALPARVTARSFRDDGDLEARDSQHGILCAEVIHALAPEAELLLANWEPERPDSFLAAARWAKEQGARVLSCSLIMPSWSDGEGGGAVNTKLAAILGSGNSAGDVLCFCSAGNTAQRHWHGALQPDAGGFHQWKRGARDNTVLPWGAERVSVEIYGAGLPELELSVHEASGGTEVGTARLARGCAVVRFLPVLGCRYQVRLRCPGGAGDKTGPFHLVVLGGNLGCATARGSIPFPADCPAAHAVGAVDAEGRRLSYSSCGPNSRLPKPDLVAEVPFPSLWRERPFAGTSAAAPQAAGLAALWWSRHPDWTARQVSEAMKSAARDLGPPGHDFATGYGRLALP